MNVRCVLHDKLKIFIHFLFIFRICWCCREVQNINLIYYSRSYLWMIKNFLKIENSTMYCLNLVELYDFPCWNHHIANKKTKWDNLNHCTSLRITMPIIKFNKRSRTQSKVEVNFCIWYGCSNNNKDDNTVKVKIYTF